MKDRRAWYLLPCEYDMVIGQNIQNKMFCRLFNQLYSPLGVSNSHTPPVRYMLLVTQYPWGHSALFANANSFCVNPWTNQPTITHNNHVIKAYTIIRYSYKHKQRCMEQFTCTTNGWVHKLWCTFNKATVQLWSGFVDLEWIPHQQFTWPGPNTCKQQATASVRLRTFDVFL